MAVITNNAKGSVVVVDRARTVATVRGGIAAVRVPEQGSEVGVVTNNTRVAQVAAPGPQGQRGQPGDGVYPTIEFAFGDASPAVVLVLNPGTQEITGVALQVEQGFNGVGASIAFGIAGQPELLMAAAENDPATEGNYDTTPRVELAGGTQLVITINPGAGATVGRGQFVIQTTPTA